MDRWCERVGRDPATVERSVLMMDSRDPDRCDDFLEAGAQHLIVPSSAPFDLGAAERLLTIEQG